MKRAPENPSSLLSRDDVVSLYGVSKRYLETAPSRGEGPPIIRIGRSVRYRVVDIETWIASLSVAPRRGGIDG